MAVGIFLDSQLSNSRIQKNPDVFKHDLAVCGSM